MLDLTMMDLSMLSHNSARCGFLMLMLGMARMSSSLLVLDSSHFEFSPPVRSYAWLDFLSSAFDFLHPGFPMLLRGFNRPGSSLFASGFAKFGLLPLSLDCIHMSSSSSLQGYAYLEFVLSVLGLGHFELPLPLQNLGRVSSPLLVVGMGRLDFSVPALDFVHMGSTLPARSFA